MRNVPHEIFEAMLRRHHRRLLAFAYTLTGDPEAARDLVQDALVAAYQNWGKFDPERDFAAWVRGIMRNKGREYARARKLITVDEKVLEAIEQQHRQWDVVEADGQGVFETLETCLAQLPDPMREVVQLYYMERLTGTEVARRVKADEATVRKRLQRARALLAECLSKKKTE